MPARGDHEQRRQQVAAVAADLVAGAGLAAATHRRIADAAGTSTTVVSHYFADKRDLVLEIYREVGRRVTNRLDAAEAEPDRLRATLEALLPLDRDRVRDWRLLFTFLGPAATDGELGEEQRVRLRASRDRIEAALRHGQEQGRSRGHDDTRAEAGRLLALVLGVGTQALFDPEGWPPERQRAVVLDAVRTASLAGA